MKNLRHVKYYSRYIAEQEFGAEGLPVAPAPVDPVYSFIFIEEGDKGDYFFPNGSSSKSYPSYELSKKDLEEWLTKTFNNSDYSKSESDIKKKSVEDYITGIKKSITPELKDIIEKFKNTVVSDIIGTKIQNTEVIFHEDDEIPTTDSIEVTFIITPK